MYGWFCKDKETGEVYTANNFNILIMDLIKDGYIINSSLYYDIHSSKEFGARVMREDKTITTLKFTNTYYILSKR